jgi:AcrR family transcriptional regulator
VDAALTLFAAQGVTDTTTKQIAELAGVNEVTLFRQFGNKHGLLLAVIEEAAVFTHLGQTLVTQASQTSSIYQVLKDYATACLQALEGVPEVVRSVVGEAGQYPADNRVALGQGFTQANRYVAEYFATVIRQGQLRSHLPAEKLASLLNGMLLGYAVIEFTSEFHELWQDRDDFLENLVTLFLHGAIAQDINPSTGVPSGSVTGSAIVAMPKSPPKTVADLPANLVHEILQRARKTSPQTYALVYLLFAAGLSAADVVGLERSQTISTPEQQVLQITQGTARQVPVNQWIMGKRYGSYTSNPLTQWLKKRKDNQTALFLDEQGNAIALSTLQQQWQQLTEGLTTPEGQPPALEQAQQTWCVEMLMKGIGLEDLSILSGWTEAQLQPYARRAREKVAIEQAIRLDQKSPSP